MVVLVLFLDLLSEDERGGKDFDFALPKGSSSSSSKKRRNKRKKNKKKSSRSKSKYGKSSSRSSRVVVEMSHVLPSSSTRRSGNAKYDVEEEEEIELFSDDEMVPHHEHEIEMVDV